MIVGNVDRNVGASLSNPPFNLCHFLCPWRRLFTPSSQLSDVFLLGDCPFYVNYCGMHELDFHLFINVFLIRLCRRLFALQVKKDLIDGELNCGENTAALLTAFVLQGKRKTTTLYELNIMFSPHFTNLYAHRFAWNIAVAPINVFWFFAQLADWPASSHASCVPVLIIEDEYMMTVRVFWRNYLTDYFRLTYA